METKFKVGDRVTLKSKREEGEDIVFGKEYKIVEVYDNCIDFDDDVGYQRTRPAKDYKLAETPQYPVIVHCPTEEDWVAVIEKANDSRIDWCDGAQRHSRKWEEYSKNSCIRIETGDCKYSTSHWKFNEMGYESKFYFNRLYPEIPIISANEYLNTSDGAWTSQEYKCEIPISSGRELTYDEARERFGDYKPQKQKIMSVIKNAFKSKEQKALAEFQITNGDGGLTETGRGEFIDFLWETKIAEKKEFIKKIVTAYEAERKKK